MNSYKISFNSASDANQLHILSRLGIQISNVRFDGDKQDNKTIETIEKIASNYVKAKTFSSDFNSDDSVDIKEWNRFTNTHFNQMSSVFS